MKKRACCSATRVSHSRKSGKRSRQRRTMRIISGFAALIGLLGVAAFQAISEGAPQTQTGGTLIIDGVAVVDVVRGGGRSPMRVVVRNGRIVAGGRAPPPSPPPGGDFVVEWCAEVPPTRPWGTDAPHQPTQNPCFPLF